MQGRTGWPELEHVAEHRDAAPARAGRGLAKHVEGGGHRWPDWRCSSRRSGSHRRCRDRARAAPRGRRLPRPATSRAPPATRSAAASEASAASALIRRCGGRACRPCSSRLAEDAGMHADDVACSDRSSSRRQLAHRCQRNDAREALPLRAGFHPAQIANCRRLSTAAPPGSTTGEDLGLGVGDRLDAGEAFPDAPAQPW